MTLDISTSLGPRFEVTVQERQPLTLNLQTEEPQALEIRPATQQFTLTAGVASSGVGGSSSGIIGFISFADPTFTLSLTGGVRTKVDLGDSLAKTVANILPAYDTDQHDYFVGGNFNPVANNPFDKYRLRINLDITSNIVGNAVRFELDIGGVFGVIDADSFQAFADAGISEKATPTLDFFTGTTFAANGGAIYATSEVDCTINGLVVLVVVENIA